MLDVAGGHGILGPVLERGIGGEIAGALAHGSALADEDENHQVILAGVVDQPIQGFEDILPGRGLAFALGVLLAKQKLNMVGIGADVIRIGEHVVKQLRVSFGVLARQNLGVLVLVDADDNDIGLGCRAAGRVGLVQKQHGQARLAINPLKIVLDMSMNRILSGALGKRALQSSF